jgi:hypothetical protein
VIFFFNRPNFRTVLSRNEAKCTAYADTGIHFGRIEQGERDVSITTLKKLAYYFDLSLSQLVSEL